jgi:hypothetical protein
VLIPGLVAARGKDLFDPSPPTPLPEARRAVPLVGCESARPTTWSAAAVKQPTSPRGLEGCALRAWSGGERDGDEETVAVADQMDLRAQSATGTPQRRVRRLLQLRRLWPAPLRRAARVFFRPRRRPAGPDQGAIETPEVLVDRAVVVPGVPQRVDDPDPGAIRPPPVEGFEDRLPGAVAFREVTPRGAGRENPQEAVDDRTGVAKGVAGPPLRSTVRNEGHDPSPLWLGEFRAAQGRTRGGNGPLGRLTLPIIIGIRTIAGQSLVYT